MTIPWLFLLLSRQEAVRAKRRIDIAMSVNHGMAGNGLEKWLKDLERLVHE